MLKRLLLSVGFYFTALVVSMLFVGIPKISTLIEPARVGVSIILILFFFIIMSLESMMVPKKEDHSIKIIVSCCISAFIIVAIVTLLYSWLETNTRYLDGHSTTPFSK